MEPIIEVKNLVKIFNSQREKNHLFLKFMSGI